jgi:hypothetical protein
MTARAYIEVVLTMSVEEAKAVRERLRMDENPKTDEPYHVLADVLAEAGE